MTLRLIWSNKTLVTTITLAVHVSSMQEVNLSEIVGSRRRDRNRKLPQNSVRSIESETHGMALRIRGPKGRLTLYACLIMVQQTTQDR
ncbi:hypothetical protein E4T42_05413 [Aureobasidium subglaciale]|nr:hypothetical protein E4T42_05413 [Aureobasidium subglaciale]